MRRIGRDRTMIFADVRLTPIETRTGERRALVACALWLHVAYIGGVAAVVGLLQSAGGDLAWPRALPLIFFGALLAAGSLQRAKACLGQAVIETRQDRARGLPHARAERPARGATAMPARTARPVAGLAVRHDAARGRYFL